MKNIFRSESGFTLLEMLAVLALLALMGAVIFPRVKHISRCELDTAARLMASDLRMVRQEAIASGNSCSAVFFVYEGCYQLNLSGEEELVWLPKGVSFKGTTTFQGNPPYVRFNRLGAPSGGGTVILQSTGREKLYVILTPVTGRVRVSSEPPAHW